MEIENRLYYYGLGAGLPYGTLNSIANAVDVTINAKDLTHRRRVAREMLKGSPWAGFIPKELGYAMVGPDTLPSAKKAIEASLAIIEDRRKTGWKARKNNPFYQCERPSDFVDFPELIEFALSDAIMHIMSDYYGLVPQMKEIGIWLTPQQSHQFSSQLFHLDKPECQLVKLFLNLEANDDASGPLTLLPLGASQQVRKNTGYEAIYFRGDGRLTDEAVFSNCPKSSQIMLGGPAGTGGFADTSNCFHFGSRCSSGERKMLTVAFMLPHKARDWRTPLFDLVPPPVDEARRLALSGVEFR